MEGPASRRRSGWRGLLASGGSFRGARSVAVHGTRRPAVAGCVVAQRGDQPALSAGPPTVTDYFAAPGAGAMPRTLLSETSGATQSWVSRRPVSRPLT